ncbi:drug/metabolite transporter (DMT)-like permease [Priestia taiwanensis]|uniref:Multidrug transporter n=1 Tax=Priestia taiwanensis TaxID=1347902 RepID=A0A917AII3_9BACI|nr:drug/metabolite transporter (DMT)-like permease [Priestia taiwanensis]GGE55568.1 multidrug transporter [Priestia taiwanensis]
MKYYLFVFLGACSYGLLSTITKLAYGAGYTVNEVTASQMFFGWVFTFVLMLMFSRHKVGTKHIFPLLFVGVFSCLTGVLYYSSLQTVPASIAIVLLFQFTWIGVILEAVVTRTFPSKEKLISIAILLVGTVLAGGVLEGATFEWTLAGFLLGLGSALTFALFIFFSGRVATELPALSRSFVVVTGAMLLIFIIFPPAFFTNGVLFDGLWKYGMFLGFFGMVIPTIFFSIGVPKIGGGMATILGAAELPVAVLMSMALLREQVSVWQWGGIILILIGIAVPQIRLMRTEKRRG